MSGKLSLPSFFRRVYHEYPLYTFGLGLFAFGYVLLGINMHRLIKYDLERTQFKTRYTVVREEDFEPDKQVYPVGKKIPLF